MKKRLVDHIVTAVTERRIMVLAIATVLCALSILSSVYLLESDMTFKGMIGKAAPASFKIWHISRGEAWPTMLWM